MVTTRMVVFLAGLLLSATGRIMNTAALPLLVLERFDDPVSTGLVLAARVVPRLAIGPFAGILADRLPRRGILAVTNLSTAGLVALVPLSGSLPTLYLLAILIGVFDAVAQPASFALLPDVFPAGMLARINTLAEGLFTVAMLSGPLLAVGLVALSGITAAFWFDAATFLVATTTLLVLKPIHARPRADRSTGEANCPGPRIWRLASRDPLLRLLLPINAVYGLGLGTLQPIYLVFAVESLGAGDAGYGALLTAVGVGALIGITLSPWLGPRISPRLNLSLLAASGAVLAAAGSAPTIWLAVGLLTVAVIPESVAHVRMTIEAQRRVPADLRGRFHGTAMTVVSGMRPLGNVLGGGLLAILAPSAAVIAVAATWMVAGAGLALILSSLAADPDPLETAPGTEPSVSH
ncbi:MAG TPA: MFS transporter [Thermomicrobiales bacterium]|nr:MFS transporter [Thermomicrobiales bacterium]